MIQSKLSLIALVVALSGCLNSEVKTPPDATIVKNSAAIPSHLPKAPTGYQWQIVENMSDEFDGEALDFNKWSNQIKTWQGRPPAEFLAKNVNVKDGELQLKTSTHPNPSEKWQMGGAAVAGKHELTYGYYESRLKTSKTRMSTTFWLHSNRKENAHMECAKQHSIELDILEAIGGWYSDRWTNTMNSNTHYKPSEIQNGKCKGADYLSKGVKKTSDVHLADDFHVFSMWWRNPNEMTFYFDGESIGTVKLDHKQDPVAFDGPMSLRMVSETYYWQEKLAPDGKPHYPSAAELDNPAINTAYYDHVRTYQLVPTTDNLVTNGDFEVSDDSWIISGSDSGRSAERGASNTHDFGMKIYQGESASQALNVRKHSMYELTVQAKSNATDKNAVIQILDMEDTMLAQTSIENLQFSAVNMAFSSGSNDKVLVRLKNQNGDVAYFDNISLVRN